MRLYRRMCKRFNKGDFGQYEDRKIDLGEIDPQTALDIGIDAAPTHVKRGSHDDETDKGVGEGNDLGPSERANGDVIPESNEGGNTPDDETNTIDEVPEDTKRSVRVPLIENGTGDGATPDDDLEFDTPDNTITLRKAYVDQPEDDETDAAIAAGDGMEISVDGMTISAAEARDIHDFAEREEVPGSGFTTEQLKFGAELGLSFAPVIGEALSAKDAIYALLTAKKALDDGRYIRCCHRTVIRRHKWTPSNLRCGHAIPGDQSFNQGA